MYSLHGTKKLRDRVKPASLAAVEEPTTWLGNWYGTALFWRPQVALLVNEQTLFPVLMPLAPAATLLDRFPDALGEVLLRVGVDSRFIEAELAEMADGQWAKTANRSVLGTMNDFSYMPAVDSDRFGADLALLTSRLALTPCGPLYRRHISPDLELAAAVESWMEGKHGTSTD